ncbi:MAG: hypothetical protein JNL92_18690 [Opitutaceae bacterium]|nr:hypothetical protein [Opitutaceae bacterium]
MNPRLLASVWVFGLIFVVARAADDFWRANDATRITRAGEWRWSSHRYAAEPALISVEEGASLELSFEGRSLVLYLDTLTPPNNYGPPELGALDVFVDGAKVSTVRPREAAGEVTIVRASGPQMHRVKLIHRTDAGGVGVRIRGFRAVEEVSGDLAFVVNAERQDALVDVRAVVSRKGQVIRDVLVRNRLTGACRLAGLPPGTGYTLELRAAGWRTFRAEGVVVPAGAEGTLPPVFLSRERDVPQDAFTFPILGGPAVRLPGETFRARFEGNRSVIQSVTLVRRQGPAVISRRAGFTEDKAAAFYYHREGTVSIPADLSAGSYDLEVELVGEKGTEILRSPRSVAVVERFPKDPVFMAWGHLDTWGQYQAEYVERLADVANLLAPDMVLVANEANPAYAAGALYRLEMPFVINFGNHRGPEPGPWFGDPVGAVDFGPSFAVINFGRAWDRGVADVDALLASRSRIRNKILNAYEANAPVEALLDRHGVTLLHYAHGPGPVVATIGATPTIRVGKSNSESFRVIRFKDGRPSSYTYRGHATAPWPFPRGGRAPVGVTYSPANDGTQRRVTARFHNDLEESFPEARAVFVLPAGSYRAEGGRVESAVASDDGRYAVVTVRFDLAAKSAGTVVVSP